MKVNHLILLVIGIFLFSCAQIVPLTGGDQDVEPPKEVESFPKNGTVQFNEEEIVIEFDEFIQLQNLSSQLIVSPPMAESPEVSVKGKKLIIELKDSLLDNTTYALNFGNAIVDITENNPIPNYKYVFSTGDYVDSLSYSGNVVNAFDLTPQEKVYVLLYNQYNDSVPYKELPRYVAITNKEGEFSVTNIAEGKYKVFAIKDINNNYLFDLPNEEIGFTDDLVTLDQSSDNNHILLFEEVDTVQYIEKSENSQYSKVLISLKNPEENLQVNYLNTDLPPDWAITEKNTAGDSLIIWLTKELEDDNLTVEVSTGSGFIDTTDISLIPRKKFTETSLTISSNASGFQLNKPLVIKTKRPVKEEDVSLISLWEDSVEVDVTVQKAGVVNQQFIIDYPFKENTNYELVILPKAFKDYFDLTNDTIKSNFTTKSLSDYGIINLSIHPNFSENYVLQLYKGKKIVREENLKGKSAIKLNYLNPGTYGLKLIIDKDSNKEWTTGKYSNQQQPEKVIYYEKDIVLKANWDNEINWIIKE